MLEDNWKTITLLNNALIKYEEGQWDKAPRYQIAGFIEGVLTSIGEIDTSKNLPYGTTERVGFFGKQFQEKETYPELMVRLANETIKKLTE